MVLQHKFFYYRILVITSFAAEYTQKTEKSMKCGGSAKKMWYSTSSMDMKHHTLEQFQNFQSMSS